MSFSGDVKQELCREELTRACCARAEAYGVLLYCNTFSSRKIRIITENDTFARRLPRLFERAFQVSFDRLPEKGRKRVFGMTAPEKLGQIINALGYDPSQHLVLHLNFGLLEEGCCRAAFLRGAFLAGGSVAPPDKRYHLELSGPHAQASRELEALLADMGYAPKTVDRGAGRMLYFKSSGQIEELLTLMGAPVAAMELMNAKVKKDLRNGVNRRVNCDAANLGKAVDAAREHLEAIERLHALGRIETLPEKLKETIVLRETFPELTLAELAAEFEPPISKSCLNHRLRKLVEISKT